MMARYPRTSFFLCQEQLGPNFYLGLTLFIDILKSPNGRGGLLETNNISGKERWYESVDWVPLFIYDSEMISFTPTRGN